MRRRERGAVRAKGRHAIELTIFYERQRFRISLPLKPTETNLRRARDRLDAINEAIDEGTFDFLQEFPDYRYKEKIAQRLPASPGIATCNEVFDRFLKYCETRVAMKDMAFSTYNGYRKTLKRVWRPAIGTRPFLEVRYTELLNVATSQGWRTKKTYNNGIIPLRGAFAFEYKNHLERKNPAENLENFRLKKKDRPPILPFTIQETETIIDFMHREWGEPVGNFDEFRFFTGLRQSEQLALRVRDYDPKKGTLFVRQAVVLGREKDRTKTHEDRLIELCPRAHAVLKRQLALREACLRAGRKLNHDFLFFKDDCQPLRDLKYVYSRWRYAFENLPIAYREPYNARHTSVTMNLMVGKNIVWVADQHGHSPEVMLTTYAQWQRGATEEDIEAIRRAMASEETTAARFSATPRVPAVPQRTATKQPLESDGDA